MDILALLRQAQSGFDEVLAAVRAARWADRSTCPEWTVRDLAGHVIWGQHQLRAWATGEDYTDRSGAPGSPHPAPIAGADPLTTWRSASAACLAALTPEALGRTTTIPGLGEVPVAAVASLLTTDLGGPHVGHRAHPGRRRPPRPRHGRGRVRLGPRPRRARTRLLRPGAHPTRRLGRSDAPAGVPRPGGVGAGRRVSPARLGCPMWTLRVPHRARAYSPIAARPRSYADSAAPTVAATVTSKISSSLCPAARRAATSASVTR